MAETLQNMVGYQLGITPSSTSVPTTTMIERWLKDGSIYVMRHAPLDAIAEKHINVDAALVGDSEFCGQFSLPADYLRFVAWISGLSVPAKLVEPAYAYIVGNVANRGFDTQEYLVWIEEGKLKGNTAISGSEDGDLIYVKEPVDSADVPSSLHDLVVLYAVARAKAEAQEPDEYQILMAELEGKIAKLGEVK